MKETFFTKIQDYLWDKWTDFTYFLRCILYAYQRVVRGYDDRIHWGFDGYFLAIIVPLKEFCENYLKDEERCSWNEKRVEIFKKTLVLIANYEKLEDDWRHSGEAAEKLFGYVGKHIGWYWD